MFGILRWHVQPFIVWSQIVHQVLETRQIKDICPVPSETQSSVGHQLPGVGYEACTAWARNRCLQQLPATV